MWFARDQSDRIDWEHSAIRGDHNLENALAAAAAAEAVGVSRAARDRALRAFAAAAAPPADRRRARRGQFVDDSKATNPEAAIKALTAYEDGVRLILGGSLKGSVFGRWPQPSPHGPVARRRLRRGCRADRGRAATAGVPHRRRRTCRPPWPAAAACRAGRRRAAVPACASFDEFRDYAERGEAFARLAQEVPRWWLSDQAAPSGSGAAQSAPLSSSTTCCCWSPWGWSRSA